MKACLTYPDLKVGQGDEQRVDDDTPRTDQAGPEVEASSSSASNQANVELSTQVPCDTQEGGRRHGRRERGDGDLWGRRIDNAGNGTVGVAHCEGLCMSIRKWKVGVESEEI